MLRLGSISLVQFRNYVQQQFSFTERIVGISGSNGSGKTNLLDAIYYLSFSKSYFSGPDSQNVHHGLTGLRLEGNYDLNDEPQQLVCILRENNRKELVLNEEPYKKFSDHIGKLPCVMIAPDDVQLVTGSSVERRTFMDTLLSQLNKEYLLNLIDYTRILQQRNSLLKQSAESGTLNQELLDVLDIQLIKKGDYIFTERKNFLSGFLPLVASIYQRIAQKDDGVKLRYESQLLTDDFAELLKASRQKDIALLFFMEDVPFKTDASQGQRKSLLFALKLAEWQVLKENKGFTPILLLDDVFEKLDEQRMFQLLNWVCTESDGQIFITDTHAARLEAQMEIIGVKVQMVQLEVWS
jgi:DNA replication and repair protein RecF